MSNFGERHLLLSRDHGKTWIEGAFPIGPQEWYLIDASEATFVGMVPSHLLFSRNSFFYAMVSGLFRHLSLLDVCLKGMLNLA